MGKVILVGAGPGDGGRLTVKGKAALERADVVVFDRLVGEEGPDHAKRFAVEVELDGRGVGFGEGRTKKEAEQMAARAAITALEG